MTKPLPPDDQLSVDKIVVEVADNDNLRATMGANGLQQDDIAMPNDADYTYDEEDEEEVEIKTPQPLNKSGVTEKAIVKTNMKEAEEDESDKSRTPTPKLVQLQNDPG